MASTCGESLRNAVRQLTPVSDSPRMDAELLLAHALHCSRAELPRRLQETIEPAGFEALLARRLRHEPVAYILGDCEFYSLEFLIRPPVLIPRPETEHLVETALAFLQESLPRQFAYPEVPSSPSSPRKRGPSNPREDPAAALDPRFRGDDDNKAGTMFRVLDLCTGSGCVACTIAHEAPAAKVIATDLMPHAVALARENAERLGLAVEVRPGDLFAALAEDEPPFDVVVSNPPYVADNEWNTLAPDIREYEDVRALLAGPDGLDLVRRIVDEAPGRLRPGGLLAMEIGETQYPAVAGLLRNRGFSQVRPVKDLAGIDRIAVGIWPGASAPR